MNILNIQLKNILKESEIIKNRLDSYKKKYVYVNDINYDEIF